MTPEERATQAHYADGHSKGCSPGCAVEIHFIVSAIRAAVAEEREACAQRLDVENISELPAWPATRNERDYAMAVRRAAARGIRARGEAPRP